MFNTDVFKMYSLQFYKIVYNYLKFVKNVFFTHACKTLVCAPFTDSENGLFSH